MLLQPNLHKIKRKMNVIDKKLILFKNLFYLILICVYNINYDASVEVPFDLSMFSLIGCNLPFIGSICLL